MWADFVTHANAGVDQEDAARGCRRIAKRAYQPAHLVKPSKTARKRAQQRWCGLFTRIAKQVRATLGSLLLGGNKIGPEGAKSIAEALKSGTAALTTLWLKCASVASLTTLWLKCVNDAGVNGVPFITSIIARP